MRSVHAVPNLAKSLIVVARKAFRPLQQARLCCKDSLHGSDSLAVSEHGAPGRRPNIHAQFVGRQTEDGLDTLPARAAEANRSTLIADIPFPAPENVAAKPVRER